MSKFQRCKSSVFLNDSTVIIIFLFNVDLSRKAQRSQQEHDLLLKTEIINNTDEHHETESTTHAIEIMCSLNRDVIIKS